MLFRRQISLHYLAKKRGSSPTKKALLSAAFFVTNFPFRPFLRRPIHMVFVSNRLSCKVWSLYAAKGIFEQFWIADDIRGNLDVYVRLGDVDFKQTESISLIGRWNIYKRRSILIGWKYILNTEIPSSSTMSLHTWAGVVGGKNFSAAFGGRKISPRGRRRGRGGGRKFFYPGGSLLVKIGQNFFTWGVIW